MPNPSSFFSLPDVQVTFEINADSSLVAAVYTRVFPGIVGSFSLAGPSVLDQLFPQHRSLWVSSSRTKYAILGPTQSDLVGPADLLTLDWVKDAQPFAWSATAPPSLLSLDWVQDGQPFAANDNRGDLDTIIAGFTILADSNLTLPAPPTFSINADSNLTYTLLANPCTWQIDASSTLQSWSFHTPKPCEYPGPILQLTCNLPFGVWQTNPNAIFTWWLVFVCHRFLSNQIPVDGYLWIMDKNPNTVVDFTGTRTTVPNAQIDLSSVAYGTGSWWFHVAAYNYVGVGPTVSYNVCYDNIPSVPGNQYMEIDGQDTLTHRPLVAYQPANWHVFTWNVSLDIDPRDILSYELQISKRPNFILNPDSHTSEITIDSQNLPMNSYVLAQTIDPGIYFWRIRGWDGSQFSDWSPTGSFRVNNPPDAPDDLAVYQTG